MNKRHQAGFIGAVEARYPGLIKKIQDIIEESERKFNGRSGPSESFLWEHTAHVAALAFNLARSEKTDPVLPAVAALFHDAGKFAGGTYHDGERAEEEDAAEIADRVLREFGMKAGDIRLVTSGLRALYNARAKTNPVADIVHDADFLSKFGALGVAHFFIKSTLRGKTLHSTLMSHLSKELTYAAALPLNMRTASGKRWAGRKSRDTLKFFRSLLRELKEAQVADFAIRRIRVKPSSGRRTSVEVRLAVPRSCGNCGGAWKLAFKTEKGIKCEKLEAEITCVGCGGRSSFSFCLPEIKRSSYSRA